MPLTKEQFLNQFTRQALDERISLFVGAGASANAGYPSWHNLFVPLAKELGTPLGESKNYYRIAQYYSNKFGQAELRKRINDIINKNDFYSPLIDELINVGFTNIWTTNFDNVLELNYKSRNILINKVFRDADLSNIELNKRINIYKMNGDITSPEGIVATQKDYEEYPDSHRMMLATVYKGNIIKNLIMDCQSYTKYRPNETTGGIFVSWRRKEELPTGA